MKKRNQKRQCGFSLIEMLMILIILGLLGFLTGPKLFGTQGKAKQKTAKIQVERLMMAVEAFRLDVGRYPTQQEGLTALVINSGIEKWKGAYLKRALPNDPWGNPYKYRNPGVHGVVDIYSYGQDKQSGGTKENADIGSWE